MNILWNTKLQRYMAPSASDRAGELERERERSLVLSVLSLVLSENIVAHLAGDNGLWTKKRTTIPHTYSYIWLALRRSPFRSENIMTINGYKRFGYKPCVLGKWISNMLEEAKECSRMFQNLFQRGTIGGWSYEIKKDYLSYASISWVVFFGGGNWRNCASCEEKEILFASAILCRHLAAKCLGHCPKSILVRTSRNLAQPAGRFFKVALKGPKHPLVRSQRGARCVRSAQTYHLQTSFQSGESLIIFFPKKTFGYRTYCYKWFIIPMKWWFFIDPAVKQLRHRVEDLTGTMTNWW